MQEIVVIVDAARRLLHEGKVTREQFAKKLGICSRTIRRWEQSILERWERVDYRPQPRKNWLDPYQRFLILWVNNEKSGGKTNTEAVRKLYDCEQICRENFNQYMQTGK